jgi:hypothetical protein
MPTFRTPTEKEYEGLGGLLGRCSLDRGVTVLKSGSSYTQVSYPEAADLTAADIVYLGGCVHTVDAAEAAALTAAGYGSYIT